MSEENMRPKDVPYIVYEGAQARHERTTKRLIVTLITALAVLFISNLKRRQPQRRVSGSKREAK